MCRSVLINLNLPHMYFFCICLKQGSDPNWVQVTPFDLILQTSQTGLLMKTSRQPTSNIAVKFVSVQFCCWEVSKIELLTCPRNLNIEFLVVQSLNWYLIASKSCQTKKQVSIWTLFYYVGNLRFYGTYMKRSFSSFN